MQDQETNLNNLTSIKVQGVPNPLILILGTTASGKTRLAVALARALDGEVISVDSRQVYQGLDIGSGKDLAEYGTIPYHLINLITPDQDYSLFDFARDFKAAFERIVQRRRLPIAAGGSALYLDALLRRYPLREVPPNPARREELSAWTQAQRVALLQRLRPQQHNTSDLLDPARTVRAIEIAEDINGRDWHWPTLTGPLLIGLRTEREANRRAITERLKQRLQSGMIEEVAQLAARGLSWQRMEYLGLEYRYVGRYLQGQLNYNDMFQKLNSAIHDFAKQQEKWFRKIESRGHPIHWFEAGQAPAAEAEKLVRRWLAENALAQQ